MSRRNEHGRLTGRRRKERNRVIFERSPLCAPCERAGRVGFAVEVDHIRPLHDGGTEDPENLQPICRDCHRAKTRAEWRARRGTMPQRSTSMPLEWRLLFRMALGGPTT